MKCDLQVKRQHLLSDPLDELLKGVDGGSGSRLQGRLDQHLVSLPLLPAQVLHPAHMQLGTASTCMQKYPRM